MKKETTGEIKSWLNKSYGPKLHLLSLCALCCLVASFNTIPYFQVPAPHHVLINMHRSLLGKGLVSYRHNNPLRKVRETTVLHCLSLATASMPAVNAVNPYFT